MGKTPKTSKTKSGTVITSANATGMRKVLISMRKHWQIYVLLIPAAIWYIMFAYYPMAGLQLAFKAYIRKNIDVKKAPIALLPLRQYSPRCSAAQDYAALADEMLARMGG